MLANATCCFTGHRPGAFPWGEDESDERAATRGGTARTVTYAREQQKEIIQIRWTELWPG